MNKQRRQILCLACVGKLMGDLKVSADAQSVSLCDRGHGQQDAMLFERQASGSWRQEMEADERAAGGGCGWKREHHEQEEAKKGGS
jgi:hypothetical protein